MSLRGHGCGARRAAEFRGSPVYSTGKPCKSGHVAFRYTANGRCCECAHDADVTRNAMSDRFAAFSEWAQAMGRQVNWGNFFAFVKRFR
jgi:hypothetical protein